MTEVQESRRTARNYGRAVVGDGAVVHGVWPSQADACRRAMSWGCAVSVKSSWLAIVEPWSPVLESSGHVLQ